MNTGTPLWLGGRDNPQARMRLFCFPAAGGGTLAYRNWSGQLPSHVELRPVKLPGREARIGEACFQEALPLARALASGLWPYLDQPFAFFGHSMGALLAFELARELRRRGGPVPLCLMVSGRQAPRIPLPREFFHTLPDPDLIDKLRTYYAGGTPEAVLREKELMALFLPVIRADFAVTDAYVHTPEPPLDCHIHAFGGETEQEFSRADLDAWREETTGSFTLELFPGGHFYLDEPSRPALLRRIGEVLESYRSSG
uniref:Surfactin synthase thioesterase subunit n=1 Tax=Candidatus Kentrum sp. FW TaxID=2126338 RepID=A0A450SIN9_9GAMM|nr:MAG: Surfactin synthase thioesterase subunit [Candidatus Kentron sp. FW]